MEHSRGICLNLTRKTKKIFNHCSISQVRDFNPDPAEYEAITVFSGTKRFVCDCLVHVLGRSLWQRDLRRGSAAARFLGFCV